ncbi:uncharacterized protein [Miscanthus floridulus]|uniref:uncharacterized protein isoform X1 n=1 Tax=Miscanthus floridulus TaxID=154761 RepID=UPI0034592D6F
MDLNAVVAACYALPVLVSVLTVRFFYVLWYSGQPASRPRTTGLRCLIVLGSGGHTAEKMNIVTTLQKDRFAPRYYVAALTDNMSLQKAQVYEQSLIQSDGMKTVENTHFMQIYRSREVGQSYITSIATTLLATLHAMWLVIRIRPQVLYILQWSRDMLSSMHLSFPSEGSPHSLASVIKKNSLHLCLLT